MQIISPVNVITLDAFLYCKNINYYVNTKTLRKIIFLKTTKIAEAID